MRRPASNTKIMEKYSRPKIWQSIARHDQAAKWNTRSLSFFLLNGSQHIDGTFALPSFHASKWPVQGSCKKLAIKYKFSQEISSLSLLVTWQLAEHCSTAWSFPTVNTWPKQPRILALLKLTASTKRQLCSWPITSFPSSATTCKSRTLSYWHTQCCRLRNGCHNSDS